MSKDIEDFLPVGFYFKDNEREMLTATTAFTRDLEQKAKADGQIHYGSHSGDHWFRVAGIAAVLAYNEGQNPFHAVLEAKLHDIGRVGADDRKHGQLHGQLSAEMAANFVDGLKIGQEEKIRILDSVHDHPFLAPKDLPILGFAPDKKPDWLVRHQDDPWVQILQDADRLDGIGAITPVKAAAFAWDKPLCKPDATSSIPEGEQGNNTVLLALKRHREWADMLSTASARTMADKNGWVRDLDAYIAKYEKQTKYYNDLYRDLGL